MKTSIQGWLARGALSLVAIAAWGTGATAQSLSGVYGGRDCDFTLTFRPKDVVYIQFLAGGRVMQELPGQYKVDGDRVAVTANAWPGAVFTRKGDTLVARYLGGTTVCTKESLPVTVQGVWTLNYRRVVTQVTQEGTPLVFDSRSAPTCAASVQPPCVPRPFYLVLDTTNQGQYGFARTPPSDPSYTPGERGSAAVARDSLILGAHWRQPMTAATRTFGLQVSSSRMHLTMHETLGMDGAFWYGWRLGPGDSLKAISEWWFQRGLTPQVARAPVAGPCDQVGPTLYAPNQFSPAYNTGNVCFDTRPIPLTPTLEAKGQPSMDGRGMMWRPDQPHGAITLPMPADASVMPSPALLLLKVSPDGRTLEASAWFSSNVKTFTDAAVDMAKNLRWKPAQKHGEAVEAWVPWEFRAVAAGASGFISVNVTGAPARPNGLPARAPQVWIDGVGVGRTPVINYQVRAGQHTIRLELGHGPNGWVNETVQVDSGATMVKSYNAAQR